MPQCEGAGEMGLMDQVQCQGSISSREVKEEDKGWLVYIATQQQLQACAIH